jgi:ubiquinone/menaquinone biosynthesis C-methylase UbiE
VTYQQGDAHSIPLQDSSVDLVTAASALHWFELPQFFREVGRVLKPHGCLAAWAIPLVSRTNCMLLHALLRPAGGFNLVVCLQL